MLHCVTKCDLIFLFFISCLLDIRSSQILCLQRLDGKNRISGLIIIEYIFSSRSNSKNRKLTKILTRSYTTNTNFSTPYFLWGPIASFDHLMTLDV